MRGKRFITFEEEEWLLDFIPLNKALPVNTALTVQQKQKDLLRKQFKGLRIYPQILPKLKKELQNMHFKTLIQPGESVGISCAQSIGEKQTQQVLNSFHKCGQSEKLMTDGVPRFQELINCSKKPKIVNFTIYPTVDCSIEKVKDIVGNSIVGVRMKDIVTEYEIWVEDLPKEQWHDLWLQLKWNECDIPSTEGRGLLRYKFNMDILYKYKIDLTCIMEKIRGNYDDCIVIPSPLIIGTIDIFWNMENIRLDEERGYVNNENKNYIYLEEVVHQKLKNILVAGTEGVSDIFYSKERSGDGWVIQTSGNETPIESFRNIIELDWVDENKILSSSVWQIYEIWGIEACRQYILNEFNSIMPDINTCHTKLLVDRMTHNGSISSISRYTLKKEQGGVIGKASFEETMDNFMNAGIKGSVDSTQGLSASVVCGKKAHIGTGFFDLKMIL